MIHESTRASLRATSRTVRVSASASYRSIVDLSRRRAHDDLRIDEPGRPHDLLDDLPRVLRPRAKLFLTTPNLLSLRARAAFMLSA